ncbi:unnamed protein product, partial [Hydatigera taeniaeformis]|uniref:PLAT domain-containing protein n=1 Tax=Hydatigena taeniaeformis TaxID=6205 RepID=A0A0R3WWI8_HYDTA
KSEVKTRNVTATAYILGTLEKEEFGSGCLLPQPEYGDHQEFRIIKNATSHTHSENNATVCTIVTWTVDDASARSLLGYVLEITQSTANTCRLIWIPCVDCFPHHSLVRLAPLSSPSQPLLPLYLPTSLHPSFLPSIPPAATVCRWSPQMPQGGMMSTIFQRQSPHH